MTLQALIDHLTTLARERDATLTTTIQLEFGGVCLSVFWEDETLPREAHCHFGPGVAWDDAAPKQPDAFGFAWILDPARFMAAMEEGLSDEDAGEECRRIVTSVEELDNYLCGRPYRHAKMGEVHA